MLSRETILGFQDKRIGKVDVPEMGGEVHIGSLTVDEMDRLGRIGDEVPASALVVQLGACDDKGQRLFSEDDLPALRRLPSDVIRKISAAVLAHNGLTAQAQEAAKNGSSETETAASGSASRSRSGARSKS